MRYKIDLCFLTILIAVCISIFGCTAEADQHSGNHSEEKERPNIVLIMTDDQGFETVGAYGGESYKTPVVDRMAETGLLFTQAHSLPVCTPTRVQIMSGQYNSRNYTGFGEMDPDIYTFGNFFQDHDYATFIGGKWQLDGGLQAPYEFGFDEYALWQVTRRPNRYSNPGLEINNEEKNFRNGEYGPDIINDYVLDFIDRHQDEPFFVYYPMILPHWPFEPTPDSPDYDPTHRRDHEDEKYLDDDRDPEYFGDMVTYTDKLVGNVLEKLKDLGIEDNTLVIFTSDNGTETGLVSMLNGEEYVGGKRTSEEPGTRVPLIIRWPGVTPEGVVHEELICFSYFFPTLADIAGLEIPDELELDGQSFAPLIYGEEADMREWLYMWWYSGNNPDSSGGEFARTHRYKYYHDGRFYDLQEDPLEEYPPLKEEDLTGEQKEIRDNLKQIIATYTRKGFYDV